MNSLEAGEFSHHHLLSGTEEDQGVIGWAQAYLFSLSPYRLHEDKEFPKRASQSITQGAFVPLHPPNAHIFASDFP